MLDENHPLNVLRVAVKRRRGGSHFTIASLDYRDFSEAETVRIPALRDALAKPMKGDRASVSDR